MTPPVHPGRTPDQMSADEARVHIQLGYIADAGTSYQGDLLESIRARRLVARENGQSPTDNFDVTSFEEADPLLVARTGDILVAASDASHAAQFLGPEFQQESVLEQRVVRFSKPGLPADQAEALAAQLRWQGVDATPNYVVPLGYVAKAQRGFELSALDPSPPAPPAPPANAVRVAVVDTGVTQGLRDDGWLAFVQRTGTNIDPLYIPGSQFLDYAAGHGQFVAGIVEQVCPDADIRMYRALSSDGIGDEIAIGNAILQAGDDGAQVINLSLGTQTVADAQPVGLRTALEILAERHPDVLVVAAAGNYGDTRPTWPAAFRTVISVAALTEDMHPTNWSSRGPWVYCSTVGEGIVSTYVQGAESPVVNANPETFGPNAWALGCGTSFAAPQIAGRVACVLAAYPALTPRQALHQHVLSVTTGVIRIPSFGLAVRVLAGTSP